MARRRGRLPSAPLFDSMAAEPYQQLVNQIVARWRDGDPPDTIEAIQRHAELGRAAAAVAELAAEEFLLRRARGEPLDTIDFCGRFPNCASRVFELIVFRRCLPNCTPSQMVELFDSLPGGNLPWPSVGERWEGLQVLEELGRGTFARVYLAEELREGRRSVVFKVSMRAYAEAQIQGSLFHPHIVPVLTAKHSEHSDFQSFVMPYLGRRTVEDWIADWKIRQPADQANAGRSTTGEPQSVTRVREVLRVGLDVVEALRHMHSRGVFHNDVKPANILLTSTGRALLFDFNLATKGLPHEALGGTIPYMAPERLSMVGLPRGVAVPPTSRASATDLFSLACVLVQMLTGQLPFGEPPRELAYTEQAAWLVRSQLNGPQWRNPPQLPPVGHALLELLESCLDCRIDHRFVDAAGFAERLDWLLEQLDSCDASTALSGPRLSPPWQVGPEPVVGRDARRSATANRANDVARGASRATASAFAPSSSGAPSAFAPSSSAATSASASVRLKRRWWAIFQRPSVVVALVAGTLVGAALEEAAWTMQSRPLTWEELVNGRAAWTERVGQWRTFWSPEDAEGWVLLGDGRLARLEPQSASACYATALRLGLDSATLRNNLGLAFCLEGRLEHAESAFASALERDPDLHEARENRHTSRQTWEACEFLRTPAAERSGQL